MSESNEFYQNAAQILCLVTSKKTSLKSAFFSQDGEKSKAVYAIVSKCLSVQPIILDALKKLNIAQGEHSHIRKRKSPACSTCLMTVVAFDLSCPRRMFGPRTVALKILRQHSPSAQVASKLRNLIKGPAKSVNESADSKLIVPIHLRAIRPMEEVIDALTTPSECSFTEVTYDQASTKYKRFIKMVKKCKKGEFIRDYHLPDLILMFPPGTDLHLSPVIVNKMAVIQDKASCLAPLVLLEALELPQKRRVKILDACAAPGIKTTLLLQGLERLGQEADLIALDRDAKRFKRLSHNLRQFHHGAFKVSGKTQARGGVVTDASSVTCDVHHLDFLTIDASSSNGGFNDVTAILLDPTCSASGLRWKRPEMAMIGGEEEGADRVSRLASLQAMLLRHALSFPQVEVVVYSTCSIHQQENEGVIRELMNSPVSEDFDIWPIWREVEAVGGDGCLRPLARWKSRGFADEKDDPATTEALTGCLRASAEKDLSIGFFIACFKRRR